MKIEIETARLLMGRWMDDDLEDLIRVRESLRRRLGENSAFTREQGEQSLARLRHLWDEHGFGHWAVVDKHSGSLIGNVGLEYLHDWPLKPKVEVGWMIDPDFWSRGFATEAGRASLQFGFENVGLTRIISTALPDNTASRRVMEKSGLSHQGMLRWESRNMTVVWYALDKDNWLPDASVRISHASRAP